jgi:hypothetical protein
LLNANPNIAQVLNVVDSGVRARQESEIGLTATQQKVGQGHSVSRGDIERLSGDQPLAADAHCASRVKKPSRAAVRQAGFQNRSPCGPTRPPSMASIS